MLIFSIHLMGGLLDPRRHQLIVTIVNMPRAGTGAVAHAAVRVTWLITAYLLDRP